MKIDYIKLSPTGNITVLVTSPVSREKQAAVAAQLLAPDSVGGEQVGFVEAGAKGALPRLQMMGGEFCGNATMSLGTVLARDAGLAAGREMDFALAVSGCEAPVPCRIRREGDGWRGTVRMPLPTGIETAALATDAGALAAPLVRMPGIAHLILPAAAGLDEGQLRRRLPQWNRAIGTDALGALLWDDGAGAIDPLVYVPSAGTLVREHGCGSGTAAIGAWRASVAGTPYEAGIRQPGGVIDVRAGYENGAVTALSISGRVEIVCEGSVEISD